MKKDLELLSRQIEAILFYKGEPVSKSDLNSLLDSSDEETTSAIETLEIRLKVSGLVLIKHNNSYSLSTGAESSEIIEKMIKEDLHRDIGKAGLETLAIIMYLGPVSRAELDNIRGVNSTFILRNLLIRGLINRIVNPNNKRTFLYEATSDLLRHLGLNDIRELPEFETLRLELESKEKLQMEEEKMQKEDEQSIEE